MSLPGGGRRWFVIVNPVAGGGRGLDHFPLISKLLRDAGIQTEPVFTEHKFHATELTVSAVKQGFRRIIAVGGDGTLHEVVNGLFIQQTVDPREVLLAVVAVGAGNDWIRTFGVPNRYQDAIRAIKEGHSFLQDVGVVSYEEAHYRQHRYMANVAGMGFDAMVVKKYAHLKKKGHRNKWLYTWCMIRSFFSYKSTGVKVWIDDRLVYNNLLMSIAIGVCKYNGGGMQQLPEAVADDGLLDVSLIRPVHFWHILFRFRYLFNRLCATVERIMDEVSEELQSSDFEPLAFELEFGADGQLPAITIREENGTARVVGKVDRVDGWLHDGKLYLRVVDYKTGKKSFDLAELRYGLGLQMLLYLFTLKEEGQMLFGGHEIVPAGVLYTPAREPMLRCARDTEPEKIEKALKKELRRSGMVLEDPAVLQAMEHSAIESPCYLPIAVKRDGAVTGSLASAEQLGKLSKYVDHILHEITQEVFAGNIDADPYARTPQQSACTYCEFASACHFENGCGSDRMEYIKATKNDEFWQYIDEVNGEGAHENG